MSGTHDFEQWLANKDAALDARLSELQKATGLPVASLEARTDIAFRRLRIAIASELLEQYRSER